MPPVCRCAGVDGVVAGQYHRPAVVVVLAGIEIRAGEAVAFGRVVAVVLVGGDGVGAEAVVGSEIDRQGVVVTEQDGFAVARHQQFGGHRAVEGPHRVRVLHRH